ncbi:unnamed protein product [Cuscuta epithymum]|uniref:Uncharacterized protein n=1 Tax=Cuscuta epithymum TaxID=186058 RepID=A0AAV0D4U4_9ASTE|nr:unnamed protein product [Cuscuta epithymum]
MAKKKIAPRKEEDHVDAQLPTATDNGFGKLESLRDLNKVLLKETAEKRHLVDTLQKDKFSLESELARSESEKLSVSAELARLGDSAARLELEKTLEAVFIRAQMVHQMNAMEEGSVEMRKERDDAGERVKDLKRDIDLIVKEKSAIEKMIGEREFEIESLQHRLKIQNAEMDAERNISIQINCQKEELASKLDVQISETNALRNNLIEVERRERELIHRADKLWVEYSVLFNEKEEKERMLHSVMSDKEMLERSLVDSTRIIDELNGKIGEIVREKVASEKERNVEMEKRLELENEVNLLDKKLLSLNKIVDELRGNCIQLEMKFEESVEKGKDMERKISELMEGKNESESKISMLLGEKDFIEKRLTDALQEVEEKKQCLERVVREKMEMTEARIKAEAVIVKLQHQMGELKADLSGLEEYCKVQEEKMVKLVVEVGSYKSAYERALLERDSATKGLDIEKQKGLIMDEKIQELENRIGEVSLELANTEADYAKAVDGKKVLEIKYETLNNEILSLQAQLAEARKELISKQTNLQLADTGLEGVLKMLKITAVWVGGSLRDDEMDNIYSEHFNESQISPHVFELEAIKKGFKTREIKVEEMKREVEFLKSSVRQANKKKSLWALFSSATTIFAAISLAYVARVH